ncbi:hypothetical protein DFH28DRAFT_890083, partial [Melampsora americana]
ISYSALSRNNIPCSEKGNSSRNCRQPAMAANTYNCGCSRITRCRSTMDEGRRLVQEF